MDNLGKMDDIIDYFIVKNDVCGRLIYLNSFSKAAAAARLLLIYSGCHPRDFKNDK